MAKRPIYLPCLDAGPLVRTEFVEFTWHPGMAVSQKRKSVESLHHSAIETGICKHPLEVSSKSPIDLGVELSAFNLKVKTEERQRVFTVETAFQSSKKFERGGPFRDLLYGTSIAAKKDPRLKESGALVSFESSGKTWMLEPKTAFYDWVYTNALRRNEWAVERLADYDAFTDIEFNPKKSINCQAYSVALFLALDGRNLLSDALESKEAFLDIVGDVPVNNACENTHVQPQLF